ncbi:unnamed protein product, partial [Protopolystoma xenopodis]
VRAIGHSVEPPVRVVACQPAQHPQTRLVFIRHLVRPFTANQLSQMIRSQFYCPSEETTGGERMDSSESVFPESEEAVKSASGNVVEELWLDRVKSTAIVI